MAKQPQGISPILPIRAIPSQQAISEMQPQQAIQPFHKFYSVEEQKQAYYKNQKQVETFLSNYSDPTELNSFIDALTNREAVSKKFGEAWGTASTLSGTVAVLSFAGSIIASLIPGGQAVAPVLAKVGIAAAVPAIPAAVDVAVEKGIKPIVAGKPVKAGLNMLMNLGETMDAVANPVKGLILEGPSGFAKGTGLASGGRVNYDYDTGFFLTDMLLEMLTDPMNWVDFGTGTVLKSATKNVAEAMTKEISAQAVYTVNKSLAKTIGEITEEGSERISKQVSKTASQVAREWASKNLDDLTEEAKELLLENGRNRIQQSLVQAIRNELPNATEMDIKGILSNMSKSYSSNRTVRGALKQIEDFNFDNLSSDVIKGLSTAQHYSDSFQKFLTANAFRTSGYGVGIELAKKGFKPIKVWASNTILRKLTEAKVFNKTTGIDIKQWTKAKAIWEAGGAYVDNITGQFTERNLDTFYECISNQLVRDQSTIIQLLKQLSGKPIEQATALDNVFKNLYGLDFYRYIDTLEQIAKLEGNTKINFEEYIKFANDTKKYVYDATAIVRSGNVLKSSSALFEVHSLDQLIQNADSKIQDLLKSKTSTDLTKTTYAIKLGNEYVDSILLQEKNINEVMTAIHTNEAIGNTLKQIIEDNNALKEGADATLYAAAQTLKRTAASYKNTELLANRIAQLVVPKIPGLNDTALKRYILNEIRGAGALKTTSELYNNIALSVNDLFERLRELTLNYKTHESLFNISDYPELAPQIEDIYKTYLKAQKDAGVENITDLIETEFTRSLYILEDKLTKGGLPDLAQSLTVTGQNIADILLSVKTTNERLLSDILVNGKTIFDGAKYRKLVDMGLAVQTITVKKNLDMFYVPDDIPNAMLKQLNATGKDVNYLTERVQQYTTVFDDELAVRINAAYERFYEHIATEGSALPLASYRYLKRTLDPLQQFAQMSTFRQLVKDNDTLKAVFKNIVKDDYDLDYKLFNPSVFMTTDFAWDGMAQSAIVAERQLTEELINMGTLYKDLSIQSRSITGSFQQMRKVIAESRFDDPRAIILERYIQKIEPMNNFLKYIEKKYDELFDMSGAETIIENLRRVCNDFPALNEKYTELINELDDYWHGRKSFKQDPKYKKEELGSAYVDEFTPFWNKVMAMQDEISQTIEHHNQTVLAYVDTKKKEAYKDLKRLNAELKRRYERDRHSLFMEQKTNVYDPAEREAYAQLKRDYDFARKQIKEEIKAKFNEVTDKTAEDLRADIDVTDRYVNAERQAMYNAYRDDINYILKGEGRVPNMDTLTELDVDSKLDDIGISDDLLVYLREEYKKLIHSTEYTATYNKVKKALKNYSLNDIDALDKWYLTGPITTKRYRKNADGVWELVGRKSREQVIHDFTKGIISQPILEEVSKVYRNTLNNKYEELFKNASERIYKNYITARENVQTELWDKLITNHTEFRQVSDDLYAKYMRDRERYYDIYQETMAELNVYQDTNFYQYFNKSTPWTPFKQQQDFNKLVNRATNNNAKASIYSLLNLAPEKFVEELACRHRFVVLFDDDIKDPTMKNAYDNLYHKLKSDKRVHFEHDLDLGCTWIVLDKGQEVNANGRQFYLNGKPIARPEYKTDFSEFNVVDDFLDDKDNPGFVKMFNELSSTLETLTGSKLGSSQGEFFSKEMLEKIYKQMPDNVKKLFDADSLFDEQFFGAYLFNESVLGTMHSKTKLGVYASNMVANARNALVQAQCYLKPKNEYVNTVFDSAFSISGKNSIYVNYTNEQLLEALQANTDYKLVALVDDTKYGVKVREIQPTTVEAIAKARELNAVVIPLQVYKDMYNTVNHRIGSAGIAKIWSRIMYAYKFGYLCRPGAWMRNWFDTNIKSYLEMGSDRKMYFDKAQKYLNEYDSIKDFVMKRKKELFMKGEESETLTQMYKRYFGLIDNEVNRAQHLTYDAFMELKDRYFSKGVADNIMRDMYEPEIKDGWDMFIHISSKPVEWGNSTERVNRLATYLYELDRGLDQTSALARLSKIHFDYSFKTKSEQLVDMIFPFTTFSLRNYSYWAEMLEKHPWLLRNYIHIMKPSWDFRDYTPEELARDKRIQAQILYGQVKLAEFEDKIITFKANPSIQDAIQMFSDPINNVYEKLAAPIAYPLSQITGDYAQATNMLPIVGPAIQSAKAMISTGTPLPSAIGVIPKRTQKTTNIKFANKNYSGMNKFKDAQYRVPNYRKNVVYDAYATKGVTKYRTNMYPVIDVYHDVKSKYTVNIYNRIKNKVQTDVYKGIRYSLRLDVNRWR